MRNINKYTLVLLLIAAISNSVNAQYDENVYRTTEARLVLVQGTNSIENILKKVLVILPNGSNQLNVSVNIPYSTVANKPVDDPDIVNPGYLLWLKVNIDVNEIQDVLTSAKTFNTHGFLTLNNITKVVEVSYVPMASGTDQNGNFNVYMTVRFRPADFNLDAPGGNKEFMMNINNAKVNRV